MFVWDFAERVIQIYDESAIRAASEESVLVDSMGSGFGLKKIACAKSFQGGVSGANIYFLRFYNSSKLWRKIF